MNRQEKTIVALLFAILLGWFVLQDRTPPPTIPQPVERDAAGQDVAPLGTDTALPVPDAQPVERDETDLAPLDAENEADALEPERIQTLENDVISLDVSSRGAAIVGVRLKKFPMSLAADSESVRFDFTSRPALALGGIAGLSTRHDFSLSVEGEVLVAERQTSGGLRLRRTLALTNGYEVTVSDVFHNAGAASLTLPEHTMGLGPMDAIQSRAQSRGQSFLELNVLPWRSGSQVQRWRDKEFAEMLGVRSSGGCARSNLAGMENSGRVRHREELAWVAAKNRFFVQILAPGDGASGSALHVERDVETPDLTIRSVAADLLFPSLTIEPGAEIVRQAGYYTGPNKYSELKTLGARQDGVMLHAYRGFGWFRSLSIALLWLLNRLHDLIPNYGVAIILLTALMRLLFWPITSRSTADSWKMRDLQPLMKTLKEKYKDDPRRMQAETWALYRQHKVNPLTSCLPMLLQMPMFIALFNILRGAVELRFASFLWISDLSEPERLLEGLLPFGLVLNILPLLMTVTTFMQQKMMPAGGDPQQQKVMLFMPLIMLFFFYNFASALALYWTVSQALAIAQMLGQRRKADKAKT